MKPPLYGPLCKAVFPPDSRGLLSTNRTWVHKGAAPTGLGPRGRHCPPQALDAPVHRLLGGRQALRQVFQQR